LATIDYGHGEQEMICNAWTMVVYEHAFCQDKNPNTTGDLIKDAMGKIIVASDDIITVTSNGAFATVTEDYTRIDWIATLKALWAMLRTASERAITKNLPHTDIPAWDEWCGDLIDCEPDMDAIRKQVAGELQRGLFRGGAAASGKTSEGQEG
jgi:hypothetical protein